MSERFEKSIQDWYNTRSADLEYLNLEIPKSTLFETKEVEQFYCFHKNKVRHQSFSENPQLNYISDNIVCLVSNNRKFFEQVNIGSKVEIKHLYQIHQTLEKHENHIEVLKKNQKLIINKITQLTQEIDHHKPLTKKQVYELVEEIAKQPKLVEAEALKLILELHIQPSQYLEWFE